MKSRFAPLDTTRYPETDCPDITPAVAAVMVTPTVVMLFGLIVYGPVVRANPVGPALDTEDPPDPVLSTFIVHNHVPPDLGQVTVDASIVSVAELVNVPKRPNTKPATAMAAINVIAMRMTVARTGLIALRLWSSEMAFLFLPCCTIFIVEPSCPPFLIKSYGV